MIDLTGITHHPVIEELVDVLCNKTQNIDKGFFRCEVAYFLGKVASSMRATIVTKDRGEIPVSIYALALAGSGYGKGHSVGIMEEEFLKGFKKRFTEDTLPIIAEQNLWIIANERAVRNNSDPAEAFEKVEKEYNRLGAYPYTFDDGTPEGIKQVRHKLLMANAGSINLQVDEIGSKLDTVIPVLDLFLELYDQGKCKYKVTKNSNDNVRNEEIDGKTPTNMLLFGTPFKLLDSSNTEDLFYTLLETGYARRCLFGFGRKQPRSENEGLSAEEVYRRTTAINSATQVAKWAAHFHQLADPAMFNWKMIVEDDVGIELIRYKLACELAAEALPDHVDVRKIEISHRYFKALKLAGAFAFIDMSNEVEMIHLKQAILLVEESGEAFSSILTREKNYVKLAKFIAGCGEAVTHIDVGENLPFFKGGATARNDMLNQGITWGYKNNIIIKKTFVDGIEFFKGESLKDTDLSDMTVSYSDNWAYNYEPSEEPVPFDSLHLLTQEPDLHWCNHHFKNKHRAEENVIPGFNMLVLDVDGGVSIDLVHSLLSEIKFMTYTTKRNTPQDNRFRLLIPINYELKLDKEEYAELVGDVISWLPFKTADVDTASGQRSKKWMTCDTGTYHYNLTGELLDILPFIPKTTRNEVYKKEYKSVASLDNLERWFAQRIANGNRSNQMIKFALALVDSGLDLISVSKQVHSFNNKLSDPMEQEEIDNTIMITVAKRFAKNAA